jgi:hypothetical protein
MRATYLTVYRALRKNSSEFCTGYNVTAFAETDFFAKRSQ